MASYEKINIRGVDFMNVTLDEAAEVGKEMLRGDKVCTVFTPNSEIVQLCIEQNEYYDLYNGGDMVVPDGAGVVKAAKILGTPLKGKVAGVELGEKMLEFCSKSGDTAFILCGFNNAITDVFFYTAARCLNIEIGINLIIILVCNTIGAIVFAELYEAKKDDEKKHSHHHSHHSHHHHSHHTEEKGVERLLFVLK